MRLEQLGLLSHFAFSNSVLLSVVSCSAAKLVFLLNIAGVSAIVITCVHDRIELRKRNKVNEDAILMV